MDMIDHFNQQNMNWGKPNVMNHNLFKKQALKIFILMNKIPHDSDMKQLFFTSAKFNYGYTIPFP